MSDGRKINPLPGAQVVARVAAVLRFAAAAGDDGTTTSEVAAASDLSRPTAHRLLSSLLQEGFLEREPATSRWRLGPEMYFMGALAARRYDVSSQARPVLTELAQVTGESAFLSARRDNETVCLLREEGAFPLRSFVLQEGSRFPLGVGSAGIVMLAHQEPDWIDRYLSERNLSHDWGSHYTQEALMDRIAETRARGFSLNPGLIVEGSWGMAAPVFSATHKPDWALSITGVESRFRPERQDELGGALVQLATRLSGLSSP